MRVLIPVSCGDLVDRITILQIKSQRISDAMRLININNELNALLASFETLFHGSNIERSVSNLRDINQKIWDDEDLIRLSDDKHDIACIAVRIFQNNDRRHAIKREIDQIIGSEILEEKSY